ncbi:ubiquitin carboxyl-terminal hydrolase 23-like isoform X2 [Glycine soja]|uniref:Ubiquitin carboxyl-terminal hydrolase n=1 Tax=Glycine soja TaxID=3848 RepID=A0A445G3G1_GLYSO|nr:ubiquitin carboxyl-terminal hydrolase 23-like isoform X2 [Glycine soja]RZB55727.1 Ubiquitin carboxyl-terminal hydrolase 23 isoform B [Glycine soja]
MAETIVIQTEPPNPPDPSSSTTTTAAPPVLSRKIVFLPVKKPFKGFSNHFHVETLNPSSSSEPRPSGSVAKKHDASEFSEYGLDPEFSFGITFRRIGAGLRNLGNTCFLNSVLQCLTYTEPLAAYLQSGKHKTSCHVAGFCALCAIQNHVSRALQSTGRILAPEDLVGNLRCISRNFRNARQEDAHEYMVNLLECMHKCCLPSGIPSESPGAYEKSFVHKIFGGRLRSQVKCHQCSYCSNKFDPFLDLSLEIFKADSLQKALSNFTAAEWLDGGEKEYHCQRCKQKVKALKQLTIHKAPYVLTIHLKRFHAHDTGQKIKKKVQFGCALDLKPFVSGSNDGDVKYSLYGVLVHAGSSTHSGHYYCYVRTSNNMWYTLDDNRVSHVSEREVLNQQAYMLFYVRDRKSIVPRKPVDIAKKENMKTNLNVNRESSTSNHVLKEYPNGTVENKAEKGALVLQKHSVILAENLIQSKRHGSELSSKAQAQKDSPDELSVAKSELGCLSSLDHSGKDYSLPHNLKSLTAPVGKNSLRNENVISKEGIKDSPSIVPSSTNPQNVELTTEWKPQSLKLGTSAIGSVCEKASSVVHEDLVGSQGLILNKSVNTSLNTESLNQKPLKKSKKKFLKYQVSWMHLRPIFYYMAYLGPRKKNHKRIKRRTLSMKNPNKDKLDKLAFSSEDAKPDVFPCLSSCSDSKATKAGYRPSANFKSSDESLIETRAEGEFRKRIDHSCAVLASAAQIENISGSGSVVSQFEARQADSAQDSTRDQMHNGLMSMPNGGPEETVVARWDDIELPSSQHLESKNDKTVSIGYVGDEWDEEYDKGKRKKIRGFKHSFGGPNLFQEIAVEKSKFKRAKFDQSCSGNPPFRI